MNTIKETKELIGVFPNYIKEVDKETTSFKTILRMEGSDKRMYLHEIKQEGGEDADFIKEVWEKYHMIDPSLAYSYTNATGDKVYVLDHDQRTNKELVSQEILKRIDHITKVENYTSEVPDETPE